MSKIFRLPILAIGVFAIATAAFADTVTLKNGERIEGKISKETATEMTLEVPFSSGITDQRVIQKADVEKVDRVPADEIAYRELMNYAPGRDSLAPAQYDAVISTLKDFATKYPASRRAGEIQHTATAFEEEKKRVAGGEVKLDGTWLSATEAQKQRVQVGGAQTFNAMKSANAAGDAIGALNAFASLEKNFPGARVMPDAIQLARQILLALRPAVERAIQGSKVRAMELEKGFADASPADRVEMKAAFQHDEAKAEAALAAASAGNFWPPFLVANEKCLATILAKTGTESARLEKLPVGAMRESIALVARAQAELAVKDSAAATENLKGALKLWPANELAVRLTADIAQGKNPPSPEIALVPVPAEPGTPVAKKATPVAKNPAATPAPGKASPVPARASTEAAPGTPAPAESQEEPKPFYMTLGGAITIVAVLAAILAAANIFSKIQQRRGEQEDQ